MPLILDDLYGDIADAIRVKESSEAGISPSDFAQRINDLNTKNNCNKFPLVVNSVRGATITAVQDTTTVTEVIGGGVRPYYGYLAQENGRSLLVKAVTPHQPLPLKYTA